jgi:hypothetical protein
MKKEINVSLEEAKHEVELASRRIGMLHIAYAKSIIETLGKEEGEKVILDSIKKYGEMIGEQTKKTVLEEGLELTPENFGIEKARSLPKFGLNDKVVEDDQGRKVYGCTMAKVWRELGEEELGQLYCFIDVAKYMYYNPDFKLAHKKAMPVHKTDYCLFSLEETTEQERKDFFGNKDWRYLDKEMIKE